MTQPINIGNRLELFVDHHLLESLDGVSLQLQQPMPAEVVLRFDQPLEGHGSGYATIIADGDTQHLYYRGWPLPTVADGDDATVKKGAPVYLYARSTDGIHFERPNLGLHEIDGSRDNNAIFNHGEPCHSFTPFIDTRPGVAASERFKALGNARDENNKPGQRAYVSADGMRWRALTDHLVMTKGAWDSQNVSFWSEHEQCYVCYFRIYSESEDFIKFKGKRTVARATSSDFIHWSDPQQMDFGDVPLHELYTNQTHPYFRAPHIYIALPKRYVKNRSYLSDARADELELTPPQRKGISDGVFMTSRGGNRYDWTFPYAFVPPGPDDGDWGARSHMSVLNVIRSGPKEMSLYYQHHYGQPSAHLRRYTLRTDGFAALWGGNPGGNAVTKPLTFDGGELVLNVATSAAGSVHVGVLDEAGKPIAGFEQSEEMFGDDIERVVRWQGDAQLQKLAGEPVRLKFSVYDAKLFSYRFR